jgi:hypothetical protein
VCTCVTSAGRSLTSRPVVGERVDGASGCEGRDQAGDELAERSGWWPTRRRPRGSTLNSALPWVCSQAAKAAGFQVVVSTGRRLGSASSGASSPRLSVRRRSSTSSSRSKPRRNREVTPSGLLAALAQLGVGAAGGLADGLQRGPAVRTRQHALEQVLAAELAVQVGAPPAEPRLLADVPLPRPRDGELGGQQEVELRHRGRGQGAAGGVSWHGVCPCLHAGVHGTSGVSAPRVGFNRRADHGLAIK